MTIPNRVPFPRGYFIRLELSLLCLCLNVNPVDLKGECLHISICLEVVAVPIQSVSSHSFIHSIIHSTKVD